MTKPNLEDILENIYSEGPSEEETKQAHHNLKLKMEGVYPTKIFYCQILNTNLGNLWIAATNKGLIAVDYDLTEVEFLNWLGKKIKAEFIKDEKALLTYRDQISKFLIGDIKDLDFKIDFSILTSFQKAVLLAAKSVPVGQVSTYGEIAKIVGKPKAFQAVGQALRYNPIPIALPCHRVIASDGSLGGYSGKMNSERKRKLLQIEGAMLF